MDFITQRFIAIGNRLLAELRRIGDAIGVLQADAQQQIESVNASKERDEQKEEVRPIWLDDVLAKYDQAEGDQTARDERHYRIQNSIRWATWCAFIAATFYGGVAALQWRTMNESYKEIAKQTPKIAEAAGAASQANIDARERFREDERPYIWFTNTGLGGPQYFPNPNTNPPTGQVYWPYHYTDYGKTPAYGVITRRFIQLGKDKPWRESFTTKDTPPPPSKGKGPPIPPGHDVYNSVISYPGEVTPDDYAKLLKTDNAIRIRIVINYTDAYGGQYESGMCVGKLALGDIQYCPNWNYIK